MNRDLSRSVFLDETYSFQIALRSPDNARLPASAVKFEVTGPLAEYVTISQVDLVPVEMPAFPGHDDNYLFDAPGLYPDLLRPAPDGRVLPLLGHWRSAWFDLRVPADGALRQAQGAEGQAQGAEGQAQGAEGQTQGAEVVVTARSADGTELFSDSLAISVIEETLPELDIVNTHWFHADGLADFYGYQVFSEEHWHAIDTFVGSAARMNVNSLLTPVWTPPLDTAIGTRRTPVQLIDISRDGDRYTFGFGRLDRWLEICRKHGIDRLEIAHLFSQWGAKATPAIDATIDGELVQIFGWDVAATDPTYRAFLEQMLPALQDYLAKNWDPAKVIYHISDEPHAADIDSYRAAREVVTDLLEGHTVVDALSNYEFYSTGIVPVPIVATDHVKPFLEAEVERLWVYYCVSQNRDVANRFIAMPSARSRVLGHQLFAHDSAGFLHWGFNFYNSAHSLSKINPFTDTCSGGAFPGGDPFVVYPGPDGEAWESIRHRVLAQLMSDHRAMQLLRDRTDRESVLKIINPDGDLSYDAYSRDPEHYLSAREQINAAITAAASVA